MKKLSVVLLSAALFGCASVPDADKVPPQPAEEVKPAVEQPAKPAPKKDEYTASDVRRTINTAVYNMFRSGTLDNPMGDKYVVIVGRVVNITPKTDFDTAQAVQDLKRALAAGRKVRVVSAKSKTVDPQIVVAGRITHRIAHLSGRKQRHEYYLHLYVTEAKTGSALWDAPFPIVHRETAVKGKTSK